MRSISQLRNEVFKIESVSGRSRRTIKLRNEIAKLEDQLSYSKNQGNIRTRQYYKTKPEDLEKWPRKTEQRLKWISSLN